MKQLPSGGFQSVKYVVEKTDRGYWAYQENCKSTTLFPLSQFLQWILEQITLGHVDAEFDSAGQASSFTIGRDAAFPSATAIEAAKGFQEGTDSLNLVGLLAELRERGSCTETIGIEKHVSENANQDAERKVEFHYAIELAKLLGRIAKKSKKLELFPVFEAPEHLRQCIAEATRCWLLKLDRACIALCRAALECAMKSALDEEMRQEFKNAPVQNMANLITILRTK